MQQAAHKLRPTVLFNFAGASSVSSLITYTGSNGTYFNSSGTLTAATTNVPRLDYDPSTLVARGLLIEEARTNSIRNNTMAGASAGSPGTAPTNWTVTGTGGVFTQTIVGTGTENGISYIDIRYQASGAGNATTQFEQGNQVAASNGQNWSTSAFIKLVGGSLTNVTFYLSLIENDAGGAFLAGADSSAIVPTSAGLATQRSSYTRTNTNASTAFVYSRFKWAFTGVGDVTLRIGMPQLELGAFATSVISTSSAAVTRAADLASITGASFSSFWNATQGTIVVGCMLEAQNSASAQSTVQVDDGTSNNRYTLRASQPSNNNAFVVVNGGVTQVAITDTLSSANVSQKMAAAYLVNSFGYSQNGGSVGTDTSGTLPTVTTLQIGNSVGANSFLNGWISSLAYYPTRLPDTQIQGLTVS